MKKSDIDGKVMEIMGAEQTEKSKKPIKKAKVSGRVPETPVENDQNPSTGGIIDSKQIQAGRDEYERVHGKGTIEKLEIKLNPDDPDEVTVFPESNERPKE